MTCATTNPDAFFCPVTGACVSGTTKPPSECQYARSTASSWVQITSGSAETCPSQVCPALDGNCTTCTAVPNCGLYRSYYCLAGGPAGYDAAVYGNQTFDRSDWVYGYGSASTASSASVRTSLRTSLRGLARIVGNASDACQGVPPCAAYASCAACAADAQCGFWGAAQQCMVASDSAEGAKAGPVDPEKPFDRSEVGANGTDPRQGWKTDASTCKVCSKSVQADDIERGLPYFCQACVQYYPDNHCVWSLNGTCDEVVKIDGKQFDIAAQAFVKGSEGKFATSKDQCKKQENYVKMNVMIALIAAVVGIVVAAVVVAIFVLLNVLIWKQGKTAAQFSQLNYAD